MMLVLLIVVPCCLVGVVVYVAMSKWELGAGPEAYDSGGGTGRSAFRPAQPRLTMRETAMDWPIPQLQRLHPGVLIGISAVLALWTLAWVVIFFVGLGMLHG